MSQPDIREPVVKERSGPSLIWLIPILTAVLGAWLVFNTLTDRGPLVTITFRTADGIEVDKTRVKYKSLSIGQVEGVRFSPDFSRVEVRARLNKEAAHFLRRDTRFWVVRPTLSARGISGLGTLLSGTYIEIEPGQGAPQSLFVGQETPPVVNSEMAGKRITLLASQLGSIDRGSPLHYQGIIAGEVLGYEMANDYRKVLIHAFVKAPYDALLRSNTRFWGSSGIDLSLNSDGLRLKTESVQALLFGGIAFDTPDIQEAGDENIDGLVFTLHDDLKSIKENSYASKVRFVAFFEDSVRGLAIGAPVEFKGIKVGSVVDVRLEHDERSAAFRIPVLVDIEPERIVGRSELMKRAPQEAFQALVKRGLRARLQMGNLVTGQLYVDLDMQPKAPLRLANAGRTEPELPTVRGVSLEQVMTSAASIMEKIDRVDFVALGADLQGTLQGVNSVVNGPQLQSSLADLAASLKSLRKVLSAVDGRAEPIAANLEQALVAAREAMEKSKATLTLVDGVIAPEAPLHFQAIRLAQELVQTSRSLRSLVEMLERNPQALLLGKTPPKEP
ncbi:PqiB family protein [Sulfurisoma sediminicola]|uniref:Paraquat-inducible protein B n=1 Tax=Sulfurisoma sediminicola TaxID=1381557 RepID=A0A497XE19_9PROT|nr:MlaD family protein [Sulfurisoma sediminicola]RLJ65203.1 paraquat-inducible protein B [Sulfurisoma sediminicola]